MVLKIIFFSYYINVIYKKSKLNLNKTIVHVDEEGEDSLVNYFDGTNLEEPFGEVMWELFGTWQKRMKDQFHGMPKTLITENSKFPASEKVLSKRQELLENYAPNKNM